MNPSTDPVDLASFEWEWCMNDVDGRSGVAGGDRRVAVNVPVDTLFEGANGRYYTEWQVRRRFETGNWKRCIRQRSPERRLVGTGDGALLMLVPIEPAELPRWAEIRVAGRGAHVVDTRRPVPR